MDYLNSLRFKFSIVRTGLSNHTVCIALPNSKLFTVRDIVKNNQPVTVEHGGFVGFFEAFGDAFSVENEKRKSCFYMEKFLRTGKPCFLNLAGKHRREATRRHIAQRGCTA